MVCNSAHGYHCEGLKGYRSGVYVQTAKMVEYTIVKVFNTHIPVTCAINPYEPELDYTSGFLCWCTWGCVRGGRGCAALGSIREQVAIIST